MGSWGPDLASRLPPTPSHTGQCRGLKSAPVPGTALTFLDTQAGGLVSVGGCVVGQQ